MPWLRAREVSASKFSAKRLTSNRAKPVRSPRRESLA